ncbi:MAG: hypothetical protein HY326_13050 [Chloroflexi bacterium]|nr:hypothetical protein [Chloroflexota bacterium]
MKPWVVVRWLAMLCAVFPGLIVGCAPASTPTPVVQIVEKPVEKVVTQIVEKQVEKVVQQTVIVEKPVEKTVEKMVTPTPIPPEKMPPQEGGTLILWNPASFTDRFGLAPNGWENQYFLEPVMEPLIWLDISGNTVPALAEKWEASPDGKVWTLKLRKAKWHDGRPFTAADVDWSIHTLLHPDLAGALPGQLANVKGMKDYRERKADRIAGFKVIDDQTVQFELDQPSAAFVMGLAGVFFMGPKHVYGDVPPKDLRKHPKWDQPIGTGPFQLVRYVTDQYVEYTRFDDYWGGKPYINKIFMRIAKPEVGLAMLEKGEIDYMVKVPPIELPKVEKMPKVQVLRFPNTTFSWQLSANNKKPIWRDKRARQALMYGIDRPSYVKTILSGEAFILNYWFGMPQSVVPDPKEINQYPYDPEKAKALFKDAGLDTSKPLQLWFYPGIKERADYSVVIQDSLRKIGINLEITSVEPALLGEKVCKEADKWDLIIWGTGAHVDPDVYATRFLMGSQDNFGYYWFRSCSQEILGGKTPAEWVGYEWKNTRADELMRKGSVELDPAKRAADYKEVNKIFNEELPEIPAVYQNNVSAINSRVRNISYNPNTWRWLINLQQWWLLPNK